MFPLETSTYPLTRNIKVEVAVIVIVAAFGIISQLRLWKVIKERRDREKSARKEAERRRDEAEAEVGRRLEQNNLRERAEWEHMYENTHDAKAPSISETAVADDSRRGSDALLPSIPVKGCSLEMKEVSRPESSAGVDGTGKPLNNVNHAVPNKLENIQEAQVQHGQGTTTSSIPNQDVDAASNKDDDDSEHGAVAGSDTGTVRSSERFSGVSWMKRLSWRSADGALPKAYSQADDPAVHDDTTSSVAGEVDDLRSLGSRGSSITADVHNLDDETSQDKGVPKTSPPEMEVSAEVAETKRAEQETSAAHSEESKNESNKGQNDSKDQVRDGSDVAEKTAETQLNGHNDNQPQRNEALQLEAQPNPQPVQSESRHSTPIAREVETQASAPIAAASEDHPAAPPDVENPATEVADKSQVCAEGTATSSKPQSQRRTRNSNKRATLDITTVQGLPEQTSKVVHAFRTKEWAKRLVDADAPEPEPLDLDRETSENPAEMEEVAAPVKPNDLLQTAFDSQRPPAVRKPQRSSGSANGRFYSSVASKDISDDNSKDSSHNDSLLRSLQLLSQNGSAPMARQQQEQAYEAPPMQRSTSTPLRTVTAPLSNGNIRRRPPSLLALRENRRRNRHSSTSSTYDAWASRSQSRQSLAESTRMISPTFSIPEEREEDIEEAQSEAQDDDNVPLAKRRVMLQRQSMQSPSVTSFQSSESPSSSRGSLDRPAATMAARRQSVREDISLKRNPLSHQKSSVGKPRNLWGSVQQMRDASASTVDHAIAEGMQRGNMTDLHRQAMRRMQASVSRQL